VRKIIYKTLRIQNFLSIGNETVEIRFQTGLNQIDGKNIDNPDRKNAIGKSAIISSHFFALFGETINKIKSDFVVNNVTKGKGLVELEFDVVTSQDTKSYTIKRQVKPSKVELWQGSVDLTRDSIANTNKYICELLQTNPTIYKCCDVMTIRETTPFMEMEAKDKRTFIEDVFSINVFGAMLKDLKKGISDTKKDKDVSSAKLTEIRRSVETLESQKAILAKQIEEREIVLQRRKDDLDSRIVETVKKLKSYKLLPDIKSIEVKIEEINETWTSLDKEISKRVVSKASIEATLEGLKRDLRKYSSAGELVKCDKCLQDVSHDHVEFLEEQRKEVLILIEEKEKLNLDVENERVSFQLKKTDIQKQMKSLQDDLQEGKRVLLEIETLKDNLKKLKASREELNQDIQNNSESLDSFDENIEKTLVRQEEESQTLSGLIQKAADLELCKFILGEEGVKSFVVKKLLDLLNNTIEKYLIKFGLGLRCKFDEYFEEIITNDKGDIFSYKNGSGAEKKSLDLACAFSFSDMRQKINQVSNNLTIIDEWLDNAIDTVGFGIVMNVLKDKSEENDMAYYIISHRKEILPWISGETVMLEKKNRITRRV